MNVAAACFWDKQQWLLGPLAQPLFDQLEAAGILFDRPEDAAVQLNAVFPDIEAWWQKPERQRARAQWCHAFARTDRHWLSKWLKAFATL
jgi:putative transferase (TIGR04331 family)